MGHQDLIAALRAQGAEKAADMRRQADEEAARIVAEGQERLHILEEKETRAWQAEEARLTDTIAAQARVTARRLLAASRGRLAKRLASLARECLFSLRTREYEITFARLAGEIPTENWERIRVNPADAALARRFFPLAKAVEDTTTIGGFELISEDGLLRINNTLEKRLERSWPSLLPGIVAQLEKECTDR